MSQMEYDPSEGKQMNDKLFDEPKFNSLPYNGQDGQPCPYGCVMKQRIAEPQDYVLEGDCRAPSQEDCCLNVQKNKHE